jgi:endoglucanase
MFSKESLRFLEDFLALPSPSGFEDEAAAAYKKYLSAFADKVECDVHGNTIASLNTERDGKRKRVMLAGHYDEIGFQVVHITAEGFICFRAVGGIDKITVPGTEVEILGAKGRVPGVIGKKPIHLQKEKERNEAIELQDLYIDIGAKDGKEVKKYVSVGDAAAVRPNFRRLCGNRIMSKGLDDKIGAFTAAEVMRILSKKKLNVAVYAVGTSQEELGLRGAITSAYSVAPWAGFAIDVGFTTDTPNTDKKILGEISLGGGPVLYKNADNNSKFGKLIRDTAKKRKIKYQESAGFRASGGTDTAQIQTTRGGAATALVSIPNRYMHTPVEICDLADVEAAVALIAGTIESLTGKEDFTRGA